MKEEICDCFIDDDNFFFKDGVQHCSYCKKRVTHSDAWSLKQIRKQKLKKINEKDAN